MARLVSDKKAHLRRLESLRTRTQTLVTSMEKLLHEYHVVRRDERKEAAHVFVRILTKVYHAFDINSETERTIHRDLYALLLSASHSTDYDEIINMCRQFTEDGVTRLKARIKAIESEIEDA